VACTLVPPELPLPGFITARVASRRRPAPATLGDLELVLRALGYSLVLYAAFAVTTWTPWLVQRLDSGHDWTNHVDALVLFAAAIILAAWLLGLALGRALDELQGCVDKASGKGTVALALFHALGGQDVRDGFDYVFARRKQEGLSIRSAQRASKDNGGDMAARPILD
jgi:Family of unknown function (DUF6338)